VVLEFWNNKKFLQGVQGIKNYKLKMINYKLKMEVVPFGRFYKTPTAWGYNLIINPFLFAEGVKNLSVGCKFHLSFIIYHLQFIIKKTPTPLAAGGQG
jgi:hypothetical protein